MYYKISLISLDKYYCYFIRELGPCHMFPMQKIANKIVSLNIIKVNSTSNFSNFFQRGNLLKFLWGENQSLFVYLEQEQIQKFICTLILTATLFCFYFPSKIKNFNYSGSQTFSINMLWTDKKVQGSAVYLLPKNKMGSDYRVRL